MDTRKLVKHGWVEVCHKYIQIPTCRCRLPKHNSFKERNWRSSKRPRRSSACWEVCHVYAAHQNLIFPLLGQMQLWWGVLCFGYPICAATFAWRNAPWAEWNNCSAGFRSTQPKEASAWRAHSVFGGCFHERIVAATESQEAIYDYLWGLPMPFDMGKTSFHQ